MDRGSRSAASPEERGGGPGAGVVPGLSPAAVQLSGLSFLFSVQSLSCPRVFGGWIARAAQGWGRSSTLGLFTAGGGQGPALWHCHPCVSQTGPGAGTGQGQLGEEILCTAEGVCEPGAWGGGDTWGAGVCGAPAGLVTFPGHLLTFPCHLFRVTFSPFPCHLFRVTFPLSPFPCHLPMSPFPCHHSLSPFPCHLPMSPSHLPLSPSHVTFPGHLPIFPCHLSHVTIPCHLSPVPFPSHLSHVTFPGHLSRVTFPVSPSLSPPCLLLLFHGLPDPVQVSCLPEGQRRNLAPSSCTKPQNCGLSLCSALLLILHPAGTPVAFVLLVLARSLSSSPLPLMKNSSLPPVLPLAGPG